jgi:hypothetical protein
MGLDEILGLLPFFVRGVDERAMGQYWLLFELGFWGVVALLTLLLLRFRPAPLDKAEIWVRQISRHERFWLVAFGLAVILIRVSFLPKIPVPIPTVHDEFSYLVASDTFSHGRLTNPSPTMWHHFESFHVNLRPTYQSMYPPAQGMALAVGQKLTGAPWAGVVLSTAVMCSALYWMLLGWLPSPWAWLGGAFSVLRFGIFSYWMNSYMGGSVAALGGILLLGALPRLRRKTRISTTITFVAGLLILANSRPLEGFLFSIPLSVAVVLLCVKSGGATGQASKRKLIPATMLLVAGLCWILYYNWRGTGNPLSMPYMVNFHEYHITKPYLFQKPNPIPEYRHQAMRTIYVFHEFPDVVRPKYEGIGYIFDRAACRYYAFYIWPFLLLVAPALPALFRDKALRVVLLSLGLLAANLFAQRWRPEAHYAAPATGAILLLLLYALRHFKNSYGIYGMWAARAVVIVYVLLMVSSIANRVRDPYFINPLGNSSEQDKFAQRTGIPLQIQRQRVKADLDRLPGKQLVIVHHSYHDVPTTDWIYNEADMDHAHILWARDMGYLENRELLNYYSDRQVWYVDRGDQTARLQPYDQAIAPWRLALEKFEPDSSSRPQNALRHPDASGTAVSNTRLAGVSNSGVASRTDSQYARTAAETRMR